MSRLKNRWSTIALLLIMALQVQAEINRNEIDLEGRWRFTIGDDLNWANPGFDDTRWDWIQVPARWEEQGFQGYNGFAWYRTTVVVPEAFKSRVVVLELGFIDDVDEVFFNGVKIGQTGSFPPQFSTAYNAYRKYSVPSALIQLNKENKIAVRTYDAQLEGGIVRGDIKLVAGEIAVQPDLDLTGSWDFSTSFSGQKKVSVIVPGQWENQGFNNYDGLAVYSKTIDIPASLAKDKLIFLAGRIDDEDEFYVNGILVGKTGDFNRRYNTDLHREFRNYFIPDGIIKPGKNLIEIKVIDRGGEGGILEGAVGLITQDHFIKYWRMKRRN
ncbi:MAG: glycoside hydrolase [Prolixibacteraceae bacterium]